MNCIYAINGPVVKVRDTKSFSMREMVMVGKSKLIGEVIGVTDEMTTIQVYELSLIHICPLAVYYIWDCTAL